MNDSDISADNKRPLHGVYSANSGYNATQQQIEARLQRIETAFIAKIDSCQSSGIAGAKTVSATPLTQMTDGNGNGYQSPPYPSLPHYRIQQGRGAIIMNPRPGDIGVFVCSKRDISKISVSNKTPAPPGSTRSFSGSDAVMVGSIHTESPTYYLSFEDDNKILIHAPSGVTIESDSFVEVNAPEVSVKADAVKVNATKTVTVTATQAVTVKSSEITLDGHVTITGGINVGGGSGATIDGSIALTGTVKADQDVTSGGISLQNHVHGGVQTGDYDTDKPK